MQRLALQVLAFAIIAFGGFTLTSPNASARLAEQAKCGDCEGVCCGTYENGTCWASDTGCPEAPPEP